MKKTTNTSEKIKAIMLAEEGTNGPIVTKQEVGLLSLSFGQEDLNKMVDKINEIIVILNKMI